MWRIHEGNCVTEMIRLEANSVDAIVTDPPYGLEFMGKDWDKFGKDTGNGYTEKPRMTKGRVGGYKNVETPNHFEAGRPYQDWCYQWALECMRVLKPGGFLLACGGTRTYHRLTSGIEDAGFEIRDSLMWIHGQGFPKNLDVSKAIDKAAGAEREVIGPNKFAGRESRADFGIINDDAWQPTGEVRMETAPATAEAQQWQGWGTALKPSHEPIVMARKPFKGTVASNVLAYGTGAINIDACRVGSEPRVNQPAGNKPGGDIYQLGITGMPDAEARQCQGRWPANVVLSHSVDCVPTGERQVKGSSHPQQHYTHSDSMFVSARAGVSDSGYGDAGGMETVAAYDCADACPVAELDRQSGQTVSRRQPKTERKGGKATDFAMTTSGQTHEDSGGASRFFMQCALDCPVAELDRQSGESISRKGTVRKSVNAMWGRPDHVNSGDSEYNDQGGASRFFYCAKAPKSERPVIEGVEGHPTVKPLALMRWLVRLVCQPDGLILDPFAGTGTTAEAALLEGFNSILIENDPVSIQRIYKRMSKHERQAA